MKKRTVIIAINGIRTGNDYDAWPRRFDTWVNTNMDDELVAERFEYTCSATFRFWHQRERADNLLLKINEYKNDERFDSDIVLVGHSNGCDLIQRILNLGIHVKEVHCFAPAAFDADFARTIGRKSFKKMFIYGSPMDRALRAARDSQFLTKVLSLLLKPLGVPHLGYGFLGLNGACFAARFPSVVTDCSQSEYDHSTWFEEDSFEKTMNLFKANFLSSYNTTQPSVIT